MAERLSEGEREALVPGSAHEWAKDHYIAYADFTDADNPDIGRRAATWRDAPTTWGEAADLLAARLAPIEALAEEWEARGLSGILLTPAPDTPAAVAARDLRAALATPRPVHPAGDAGDAGGLG